MSIAGSSARSRTRQKGAICYEFERNGEIERIRTSNTLDPSDYPNREIDRDARVFDAMPDELGGPGSDERRLDCGDDFPAVHCPDCGEPAWVARTCYSPACPRCWIAWDFRTARTAAAKLDGYRRLKYSESNGREQWKLHHVVVSLPPSIRFDSDDPLGRTFDLAKLLLAQVDAHAGMLAYHPNRIKPEYRGDVLGHDSGDGDMTWKDVLSIPADERAEYLEYSPHVHAVVVSPFVQGGAVTKAIEEKTGVVVERITPGDSPTSVPDLEALCKVTAYALSHTGVRKDSNGDSRAAYRYFGEVANTQVRDSVMRDVDPALRSVAPTVLGMEFPEPRCSEDRLDIDDDDLPEDSPARGVDRPPVRVLGDGTSPDSGHESGAETGSTNTGFPDSSGAFVDESGTWDAPGSTTGATAAPSIPADASMSKCDCRLVPMRAAPEYLNDPEWCSGIADSTLSRLRKAHAEFLAYGGDDDPPPVPPPD